MYVIRLTIYLIVIISLKFAFALIVWDGFIFCCQLQEAEIDVSISGKLWNGWLEVVT